MLTRRVALLAGRLRRLASVVNGRPAVLNGLWVMPVPAPLWRAPLALAVSSGCKDLPACVGLQLMVPSAQGA